MIELYNEEFLDRVNKLPDNSIDVCYTDPPYPREYLYMYELLAVELSRVLKDGGSFISIVPHYSLPEVLISVRKHLKYRWMTSMWQDKGSHPRMAMGIEVMWKPLVWWVKRAYKTGRGFVRDGFENIPPKKKFHKWEQSITWAEYCLKFVDEGDVVLDPFMGTGTLGIVCKQNNINFIGIDNDPEVFKIAQERIGNA